MFICDLCGCMFDSDSLEELRVCPDCGSNHDNHTLQGFTSATEEDGCDCGCDCDECM